MLFTRPVAWKKLDVLIQITLNLYEMQCLCCMLIPSCACCMMGAGAKG